MLNGYRNLQNAQALKSLLKAPTMPNTNLAIAGDDEMSNYPLLIFRDQHLKQPTAVTEDILTMPYEKTAVKGAGDTLSMDDFETQAFDLGNPYDGVI